MSLNKINESLKALRKNVQEFDQDISAHRRELLNKDKQTVNDKKLLSHLLMLEIYSESLKQFMFKLEKEWERTESIKNITEAEGK